jgi:hypothetical protein
LAVEIRSPSLFQPSRLLVAPEIRGWLDAPPPPGASRGTSAVDVAPLVSELERGLPEGVAVVLGAWCGRRPKGDLVRAIETSGRFEWVPVPPPPKPWEDATLSEEQRRMLRDVLRRAAGDTGFSDGAERLLLERLGFAPRLLVQETGKLVAAVGTGSEVDEDLVRELTFPRERSLEVVRDAVLGRESGPLLDLLAAADDGLPIVDWRGQRLDPGGLPTVLFPQVAQLLVQLLFLRRAASSAGLIDEMDPGSTSRRDWYRRRFTSEVFPRLIDALEDGGPHPLAKGGKPPTQWTAGQLFSAAGRFTDSELIDALAAAGEVEARLRGSMPLENLTVWITGLLRTG